MLRRQYTASPLFPVRTTPLSSTRCPESRGQCWDKVRAGATPHFRVSADAGRSRPDKNKYRVRPNLVLEGYEVSTILGPAEVQTWINAGTGFAPRPISLSSPIDINLSSHGSTLDQVDIYSRSRKYPCEAFPHTWEMLSVTVFASRPCRLSAVRQLLDRISSWRAQP